MLGRLVKWWRKRKKEKKRLALLALVRKVREEQGDYDDPSRAKVRPRPVKRGSLHGQRGERHVRDEGRKPSRKSVQVDVLRSNDTD